MATMLEPPSCINLLQQDTGFAIPATINPTVRSNSFHVAPRENQFLPKPLPVRQGTKHTINFPLNQGSKPNVGPKRPRRGSNLQSIQEPVSARRARHLERSRIAAHKWRLKKKREREEIEHVSNNETAKRDALLAEVKLLKEELWQLKNRILEHAKCGDRQINLQLMKMTQKILESSSLQYPAVLSSGPCSSRSMESMNTDLYTASPGPFSVDHVLVYPEEIFDSAVDLPKM